MFVWTIMFLKRKGEMGKLPTIVAGRVVCGTFTPIISINLSSTAPQTIYTQIKKLHLLWKYNFKAIPRTTPYGSTSSAHYNVDCTSKGCAVYKLYRPPSNQSGISNALSFGHSQLQMIANTHSL